MTKLARCQLVPNYGPKIRTAPPGFAYYQHITYGFHNGESFVTLPGRVQIRYRNKRYEISTVFDKGGSVRGTDLGWLIQQCDYELITDDEYFAIRNQQDNKNVQSNS